MMSIWDVKKQMHGTYYKILVHHDIVLSLYKQPNKTLASTHSIIHALYVKQQTSCTTGMEGILLP
jgi:metal-dependent HD superfamily phosphatase/phosphodiesterase